MCWSGEPGTPGRTESTEGIPTDAQIKKEIAASASGSRDMKLKNFKTSLQIMLGVSENGSRNHPAGMLWE